MKQVTMTPMEKLIVILRAQLATSKSVLRTAKSTYGKGMVDGLNLALELAEGVREDETSRGEGV